VLFKWQGERFQTRLDLIGGFQADNVLLAAGLCIASGSAHTPDAVATALKAMRPHVMGRLVVILGAGGDRDTGKRPLMGAAAAQHADVVIVTDDRQRPRKRANHWRHSASFR